MLKAKVYSELHGFIRSHRIERNQLISGAIAVSVIFLISCLLAKLITASISPTLREIAETESVTAATRAISYASAEYLASENISYDSLVTLTRTENGTVTSLETNTKKLNTLAVEITEYILDYVSKKDSLSFSVPIGSLTNNVILSGKGPHIRVKATVSGGATGKIESKFESAGLNQSCHKIILNLSLTYKLILPDSIETHTVTVPLCLAETVIVGDVSGLYPTASA